jgi:Mannosylglycerate hydrolase MGH1-like glycoside hydrolase domain/Glycosyl hydrolase family 63 C-terminal domain
MNKEEERLEAARRRKAHWNRWGPYLSDRQWGTVREDYTPEGDAWTSLPHDHARLRAYRWGEDGLGGISDRHQYICFAPALWNGRDPILKERLFGLNSYEGNHAEDVKEAYFYLDSTPTHSYMKYLYKYPQREFPYARLVEENGKRGREEPEFELADAGVFDGNRYFDVFVEYAKAAPDDVCILITAYNRGPETAELDVLPTVWLRNTWAWGRSEYRPRLVQGQDLPDAAVIQIFHRYYGARWLLCEPGGEALFTENETNAQALWGRPNSAPFVKDAFHRYVVEGAQAAVNPARTGTKSAIWHHFRVEPGDIAALRLRLTDQIPAAGMLDREFAAVFAARKGEADEFYRNCAPADISEDGARVQRQAFAGLLWSKQFYFYDVQHWLDGDPVGPAPPKQRREGRNRDWRHLHNEDIVSMPDKWEYPWYAAWDLAFHTIPLALIDPDFAKEQLILFLREWYMHPNGQVPAYEWALSDVNPPVHAWAVWRVYKIERRIRGVADRAFLERAFHKLLLNFTWWVNRKDVYGRNVFQGGFLGLDNIGVFDRSKPLPTGGYLEQSDATSWMGMYCLNMLAIALELARENRGYADVAIKFLVHFIHIANAMHDMGSGIELWDEQDGFYYDVLSQDERSHVKLKVRSMVGLIPLFAVQKIEPETFDALPDFRRLIDWYIENRPRFRRNVIVKDRADGATLRLLSIVDQERLRRVLGYMLDENEFLSPYGVRSLSRYHRDNPYILQVDGTQHRVDYEPAESTTGMFGGNSNWRGPVWFPVNFLIVESLQRFHDFLGPDFQVECPTGSGRFMNLWQVAAEISRRLNHLFLRGTDGRRPIFGDCELYQTDPHWRDHLPFHEYFHGDNGKGLGASHQTGWTGLVAKLLEQSGE